MVLKFCNIINIQGFNFCGVKLCIYLTTTKLMCAYPQHCYYVQWKHMMIANTIAAHRFKLAAIDSPYQKQKSNFIFVKVIIPARHSNATKLIPYVGKFWSGKNWQIVVSSPIFYPPIISFRKYKIISVTEIQSALLLTIAKTLTQ